MTSRELGVGNRRVFRRPPPSDQEVRFVAPDAEELARGFLGATASSATLEHRAQLLSLARRRRARFQPLPQPTGQAPFRLNLDTVLADDDITRIATSGKLVFHAAGDVGGIGDRNDDPAERQGPVVACMKSDCQRPDLADTPAFFYVLGDVVYFRGEAQNYFQQFYQPYEHYPAPIFAIPGNHDGDYNYGTPSLAAFVSNFCSPEPAVSPDALNIPRDTMTQPNVYFTLETPLATLIGLYSNVPEGGEIRDDQSDWFVSELQAAPEAKALIVAVHHPLYSADTEHFGSRDMISCFRDAIERSGRVPDLVLTGHVHNYQRYTWEINDRQVPVIVAGAGGYPNLHRLPRPGGNSIHTPYRPEGSDATLETYVDNRHGFLRVEVTGQRITGKYYAVPWNHDDRGERMDRFHLDRNSHRLVVS